MAAADRAFETFPCIVSLLRPGLGMIASLPEQAGRRNKEPI